MSSEVNGLRRADRLMGGGALVLLVVLFFVKWYEAEAKLGAANGLRIFGGSFNGWHAFTHSRWIWLLTIIAALAAVFLTLTGRKLELGVPVGTIVAGLGLLSAAAILYRIVHHPIAPAVEGARNVHVAYSSGIELGIWIALAAALAITYGGYLAMRDERAATARESDTGEPRVNGQAPRDAHAREARAFSGMLVQGGASARDDQAPAVAQPPAEPSPTAAPAPERPSPEPPSPEAPPIPPPAAPPSADRAPEQGPTQGDGG